MPVSAQRASVSAVQCSVVLCLSWGQQMQCSVVQQLPVRTNEFAGNFLSLGGTTESGALHSPENPRTESECQHWQCQ